VRPLPRLHAITNHAAISDQHFRVRLAAIAALGNAVALHARSRDISDKALVDLARRMQAHAAAPGATTFVNGRPDIAQALDLNGVQLRTGDLSPGNARTIFTRGWIGVSIHTRVEALQAVEEGADFLLAGTIFPSETHPGHPTAGLSLLHEVVPLGIPVVAIGGITPDRAVVVAETGAYGVAAISALWEARDSAAAATELLKPWMEAE
jgi:thiamine-phosphate pyrophosphorylase